MFSVYHIPRLVPLWAIPAVTAHYRAQQRQSRVLIIPDASGPGPLPPGTGVTPFFRTCAGCRWPSLFTVGSPWKVPPSNGKLTQLSVVTTGLGADGFDGAYG